MVHVGPPKSVDLFGVAITNGPHFCAINSVTHTFSLPSQMEELQSRKSMHENAITSFYCHHPFHGPLWTTERPLPCQGITLLIPPVVVPESSSELELQLEVAVLSAITQVPRLGLWKACRLGTSTWINAYLGRLRPVAPYRLQRPRQKQPAPAHFCAARADHQKVILSRIKMIWAMCFRQGVTIVDGMIWEDLLDTNDQSCSTVSGTVTILSRSFLWLTGTLGPLVCHEHQVIAQISSAIRNSVRLEIYRVTSPSKSVES